MATEKQGIMSLPQGGESESPQVPQMGLEDSYDAVRSGLQDVSPEANAAMQQTLAQITPQLDQLSDEQLDAFIQIFQYLQDHPEEYEEKVQDLVSKGIVEEGTLPDQYDPEVLATLTIVFLEAKRQRQAGNQREAAMAMPQPPAGMARGGIAEAARMVASKGRSGDTMLAHINKKEAAMLRKHGGMGTINPATGLPEYGFWKKATSIVTAPVRAIGDVISGVANAVKSVVSTVKSIVQSPVGKILGTVALAAILGPTAIGAYLGTAGTAALAAGTVTALGGGNLKDILRSSATAYLGAPGGPVENFIGNAGAAMGVTNAAGQAAINAGLTGTGVGLLTGQSLKDSVKSGLIAGAIQGGITGSQKGFDAQVMTPEKVAQNIASGGGGAQTPLPGDVSKQIQAGGAPAPTDPLGDFIQENDRLRALANTPAVDRGAAQAAGPLQPVPTVGQSLSKIGGGLSDIAQGNFSQGFESAKGGLGDLFMPGSRTPEQLATTDAFKNARASGATYTEALKAASDAYNPGALRTYGPGIVAGLAATGAMGGFQPTAVQPSQMMEQMMGTPSEDLIKANPRKYITQNLPGVEYDATGNIIGSKPWAPSATMADVRVPANSVGMGPYNFGQVQPPMGAMYTPGMGTLGQSPQVYQPYNTANMYTNLMFPRRAAEGGIMELEQPVQHRWFGGIILNAIRKIDPNVLATAPAAAPAAAAPAAAAPAAAAPAAAPEAAAMQAAQQAAQNTTLANVQAAPAQYVGVPTAPSTETSGSYVSPLQAAQMEMPVSPPSTMLGRMTPEMRAAFARRFALNLQFDPQEIQQAAFRPSYNTNPYSNLSPQRTYGLASLAEGGYPRRTGQISGPGTEKSDSIPAMLSDGEFVMTAKAVRGAGNGSRRAGAKKMYALMHQLERNASRG